MARFSFSLPIFARCERPRAASFRFCGVQPGRLAQGPEEKCGTSGREAGFATVMNLPFQIASLPLGGGVPPSWIGESPQVVKEPDARSRKFVRHLNAAQEL